ncbi:MAG: 6-carboxytetrahydropterin synthase [Sedimenticola sp.]|nr:6-carboxytetrahydropterin synthase [Sedimenticola sp.]
MNRFAVRVHPGELHFNAAHFITFNRSCENLHGHNFHLSVEAWGEKTPDAFVIDFVLLNKLAANICEELHDGVLVPTESEEITLSELENDMLEIRSYDKRFILSRASCILLPITNTTAEMLASHISNRLIERLRADRGIGNLQTLKVSVEEADHQWGICLREITHDQY